MESKSDNVKSSKLSRRHRRGFGTTKPCAIAVAAVVASLLAASRAHADTTVTWTGSISTDPTFANFAPGVGNYDDPTQWSTGYVPNSYENPTPGSYDVFINNGTPVLAGYNTGSYEVANLTVAQGSQFILASNQSAAYFFVDNTLTDNGNVSLMHGAGGGSTLFLGSGPNSVATITGSGTLYSDGQSIVANGSPGTIINDTQHTIAGNGVIVSTTEFDNKGTVNGYDTGSNVNGNYGAPSATALSIVNENTLASSVVNTGTLESSDPFNFGAGTVGLYILTSNVSGNGTIQALNGSVVQLENSNVTGNTFKDDGQGGMIQIMPSPATPFTTGAVFLSGVTNNTTVQVNDGATLNLEDTITNNGTITTASSLSGTTSILIGSGAGGDTVTLTGTGSLVLTDQTNARLAGASGNATERLINDVNHTITGAGTIANLDITNNGTISASVAGQNLLLNNTVIIATGTTNGSIQALNGGIVQIQNSFINDNTFSDDGLGGMVQILPAANNSTLQEVTNNTTIQLNDGANVNLRGTITNNGTLTTASTLSGPTQFLIGFSAGETVSLDGTGSLVLTDQANAQIAGAAGSEVLANLAFHTITGTGTVSNLTVQNYGNITASVSGKSLIFDGTTTTTNIGTFTVQSGAVFEVDNLTNYDKTNNSLNGGHFIANNGTFKFDPIEINTLNATVVLNGANAELENTDGTDALAHLMTIGSQGSLTIENGKSFSAATLTNNGALVIGSGGTLTVNNLIDSGTTGYQIVVDGKDVGTPGPMAVAGLTTLSGELDVSILTTSSPQQLALTLSGDTFDVLDSGTLAGIFTNTVGGRVEAVDALGNDLGSFAVTYNDLSNPSVELGDFVASVPEPTSAVLLVPAVAFLMRRRTQSVSSMV